MATLVKASIRRKRAKILLSYQQQLRQAIGRKNSATQSLVLRAKIILLAEVLQDNKAVAMELNFSAQLVGKWCYCWNDLIAKNSA
ncbi:MAG: hypothetical protein ACI86X_000556 [Moritella sp.]|jgi:hypothetical protein